MSRKSSPIAQTKVILHDSYETILIEIDIEKKNGGNQAENRPVEGLRSYRLMDSLRLSLFGTLFETYDFNRER